MFNRSKRVLTTLKMPMLVQHNHSKPNDVTAALMHCTACDTQVVANFSLAAACPICTDTMAPARSVIKHRNGKVVTTASGEPVVKTIDFTKAELSEMPMVAHCVECDTDYRSTAELTAALGGMKLSCMVCASTMLVMETASDEGEPEEEESLDPDDAVEDDEESEEENPEESSDEEEDEESDETDTDPAADDETDEEYADGIRTQSSDEDAPATVTTEEKPMEEATTASIRLNVFDKARKTKGVELSLAMSTGKTPTWYLFADNAPVAYTDHRMVSASMQNKINTLTFAHIFLAAAKDGLTDEVVADFGLVPLFVDQPVSQIEAEQVKAAVEAATIEINAKAADIKSRFDEAVSIASVGINKGCFGTKNPLRDGFIAALASVNVHDAEALVDSVLAQYLSDYTRAIVAKAIEIEGKSDDAIATMAQMVIDAPARTSSSTVSTRLVNDLSRGSAPIIASYEPHAKETPTVVDFRRLIPLGKKHF